jgi:hypothetical protein
MYKEVVEDPFITQVISLEDTNLVAETQLREGNDLIIPAGVPMVPAPNAANQDEPQAVRTDIAKSGECLEIKQHRRIRNGRKGRYARAVLDEVKAKFMTPKMNEANVKAVTRFAERIMSKHGLRPTHRAQILPCIVHLTFVPSQSEMRMEAVLKSGYFDTLGMNTVDEPWHRTNYATHVAGMTRFNKMWTSAQKWIWQSASHL